MSRVLVVDDEEAIRDGVRYLLGAEGLEVADSGPGVPAAIRGRIFDRFVRSDDDGGRGGAGLGLAIAAEAAVANRGSLELVDTDEGATFRFTLPGAKLL